MLSSSIVYDNEDMVREEAEGFLQVGRGAFDRRSVLHSGCSGPDIRRGVVGAKKTMMANPGILALMEISTHAMGVLDWATRGIA